MHTVLIVDDAEDILELAQIGFDIGGWTCQTADSGDKALAALQSFKPDIILLDYDLRGETGVDILGRIRAANVSAPVVFLTGKNQPEEHKRLMEAGATGVLTKPFDPMTICSDAEAFLGK